MEINNIFTSLDNYEKKNDKIIILTINFIGDKLNVSIKINNQDNQDNQDNEDNEDNEDNQDNVNNNGIDNILTTPEWRYYGVNDTRTSDPTRCGMAVNPLLPQASVGSTIKPGYYNKSMNHAKRMNDWHSMPYKERSLYNIYNELQEICISNNLKPIIIQEAKSLYKIISEQKISRGNNRIGIKAACIYFACKNCEVPRSTKEISEMFNVDNIIITKGCKKFQEILHTNKQYKNRINKNNIINSNDFLDRFCNKLNLNIIDIELIKIIANKSVENKLVYQNTPPSIAAGSIYYYIKDKGISYITKKDISNISKISEVTINKCFKKLYKHKNLLI